MSHQQSLQMIETSHISPPNGTVPSTKLPLTFFDVTMLNIGPVESLYFYSHSITTDHFLKEFLPNLKQSLSITLQYFFPYASSIIIPPLPELPYLSYVDGQDSSLLFIVSECLRDDFDYLISDLPKDAKVLDDFMPKLPPLHVSPLGFQISPIMTMQVTVFPGYGISIGNASTHVVGDGISFSSFMKFWMYKSNGGDPTVLLPSLPIIHSCRNAIKDPDQVSIRYLGWFWSLSSENQSKDNITLSLEYMVRATFTVRRDQLDSLKRLVKDQTSTFVVSLALTWVNMIKTLIEEDEEESVHLIFIIDCRNRLKYEEPIPSNYLGNCVAPCFLSIKKQDLAGENGVLVASYAIRACIKQMLSGDIVKTATTWGQRVQKLSESRFSVFISGSPMLGLYGLDFGLGKPCKLEIMHTKKRGLISISESRDGTNGVQIGLVLEKTQMEAFSLTLQHELNMLRM